MPVNPDRQASTRCPWSLRYLARLPTAAPNNPGVPRLTATVAHPEPASMPTNHLDYDDAIEYLYRLINYEKTGDLKPYPFRLKRMHELVHLLDLSGVAGAGLPLIHIAGTKGKGSTATMAAAMLTACGVRTGLYTSPHLLRIEERFKVDGREPSRDEMVELIAEVREAAQNLAANGFGKPTFFELTTTIALSYFRRQACQAVVLEVGLGGLLDSTNVCHPAVTAITSIGLDHQHILGETIAEIAFQKAGIIKPSIPVVCGVREGDAAAVIEQVAREQGAPLFKIGRDFDFRLTLDDDRWGSRFDLLAKDPRFRPRQGWSLPLPGEHQGHNAAVACALIDLLDPERIRTPLEAQGRGLAAVRCAGRIERFRLADGTEVILDTSHNVESISALCDFLQRTSASRLRTVIFGTSKDKPYAGMLAKLEAIADRLILTRYHGNPRFRETGDLLAAVRDHGRVIVEETPSQALRLAQSFDVPPTEHQIVICGSFFLAAELLPLIERS